MICPCAMPAALPTRRPKCRRCDHCSAADTFRTDPALPSVPRQPLGREAEALSDGGSEAYVRRVITLVRLARVLLIFLLATLVISFVIGVGDSETGAIEKVALLALIAA